VELLRCEPERVVVLRRVSERWKERLDLRQGCTHLTLQERWDPNIADTPLPGVIEAHYGALIDTARESLLNRLASGVVARSH